jgi:cytochrome P450
MNAMTMTLWDPAIFPNPGRFDPAQFEDQSAIPPFYFMPFGGGARFLPWE